MKNLKTLFIMAITFAGMVSCSEEIENGKTDPELPDLSVSLLSINVPAAGSEYSVEITTNAEWTASVSADWCTISPASGTGNSQLNITVAANPQTEARSATITVSINGIEKSITVNQAPKEEEQEVEVEGAVTMKTEKTTVSLYIIAKSATIDWGDGTTDDYAGEEMPHKHTYTTAGEHEIIITGANFTQLYCNGSDLTELDVSDNPALVVLNCSWNKLSNLYLGQNKALRQLSCDFNGQLTNLDVSKNTALEILTIRHLDLQTLDVTKNTALTVLDVSDNPRMTSINLSKNTELLVLGLYLGEIPTIDLSNNTALRSLHCSRSKISALDLSRNTALNHLTCEDNQMTSLDLSNNPELIRFWCRSSNLTDLKISSSGTALKEIVCGFNQLPAAALDAIFANLPVFTGTPPDNMKIPGFDHTSDLPYWENDREWNIEIMAPYEIYVTGNPGAAGCNETIATSRGWSVGK